MTHKEKAEELVGKFLDHSDFETTDPSEPAKQCAIICVDEILMLKIGNNEREYYDQVKQEIRLLK